MFERERLVEVFASPRRGDIRDRALVLRAGEIPFIEGQRGGLFVLSVEAEHAESALRELRAYETENQGWPPPDDVPRAAPLMLAGVLGYLLVIGVVRLASTVDAFGLGWQERGAARAGLLLGGEPWRAVTALTLHVGPVHIISNALFGSLFGLALSWSVGGGLGWCAVLVSAACANVLNAALLGPEHASVGASTAVFAALGLLVGSEWRRRKLLRQRLVRRLGPVLAGLVILSFHGIPFEAGSNVDVGAHVLGFVAGIGLGTLLPALSARGLGGRRAQGLAGMLALSIVGLAWILALA